MIKPQYEIKDLLAHFRKRRDSIIPIQSIFDDMDAGDDIISNDIEALVDRNEIFKIGEDRYMYSNNSELVAFELFRNIAPNISFEEFVAYRDEEHVLMILSRTRTLRMRPGFGDEEEIENFKSRGSPLK